MDSMGLAQLKRQAEWYAEQGRHSEREFQAAELAVETAKKNAEQLKKRVAENKQKLEVYKQDVIRAEEEVRKKIANDRQR